MHLILALVSKPYAWMCESLGHYSWLKLAPHVNAHVHFVTINFECGKLDFGLAITF
jgi:hypothetical protein